MLSKIKKIKSKLNNDFYVEIQRSKFDETITAEKNLLEFSFKLNIPIVATNDSFFKNKDQFEAFEILSLIDKGKQYHQKKYINY